MQRVRISRMLGILVLSLLTTGLGAVADDGPSGRVTVSGISSGAYAAVQSHIALSNTISGVAAIAGGPYHCAEGSIMQALGGCLSGADLDVSPLIEATRTAANAGAIDPLDALTHHRVWLFHGQSLDQASIVPVGGSFADSGFAYVPEACSDNPEECRLHLAFHGCRQGSEFVDDRFARMSGLNEWPESNRIVVLYPQVNKSLVNPQGCWDWWGYTGADYDQRSGKQIAGVAALIAPWSE